MIRIAITKDKIDFDMLDSLHLPNIKVVKPHPYPRCADAVVEEFAGLAVEGSQPISAAVQFDDCAKIA